MILKFRALTGNRWYYQDWLWKGHPPMARMVEPYLYWNTWSYKNVATRAQEHFVNPLAAAVNTVCLQLVSFICFTLAPLLFWTLFFFFSLTTEKFWCLAPPTAGLRPAVITAQQQCVLVFPHHSSFNLHDVHSLCPAMLPWWCVVKSFSLALRFLNFKLFITLG